MFIRLRLWWAHVKRVIRSYIGAFGAWLAAEMNPPVIITATCAHCGGPIEADAFLVIDSETWCMPCVFEGGGR